MLRYNRYMQGRPANTAPPFTGRGLVSSHPPRPALRFLRPRNVLHQGSVGCRMHLGNRGASPPNGTAPHRLRAGVRPIHSLQPRSALPSQRLRAAELFGFGDPPHATGGRSHRPRCAASEPLPSDRPAPILCFLCLHTFRRVLPTGICTADRQILEVLDRGYGLPSELLSTEVSEIGRS